MSQTMANPDLRRKIKVRVRPDLVINKQRHAGQTFFVVKDPISLRYFRFREEELFLLKQFDGFRTLDDVRHEFVEKFRPQRISVTELERFVGQILQAGIATADTPQLGQRLFERYRKRRIDKLKRAALNILYIKIPVFDPERLLGAMLPYTRFLFTLPAFLFFLAFALASGMLVLVNWQEFLGKLPSYQEFFTPRNLLVFWATLGIVKIMHEFGHGLSCKRFGGEVHEMGFLILVLSPCLYCNVTDAWMLPNKWHRAIIGAAGIYVELILSSMFVWIWWYTEPGLLNTLSLGIIFICSVSTVVFNANPLMRFDGYYILSDLMEIPNLRERSNKYLGNLASRVVFGAEAIDDPYAPKKRRWFFASYAFCSYIYRWIVTYGILWFLYQFLKPYKLGAISALLACIALVPLLIVPIYRIVKTLQQRWRSMKVNKLRMASSLATLAAVISAALLIPFPMRIDVPAILQPQDVAPVFVHAQGRLEELRVKDGDPIDAKGQSLATLVDYDLQKKLDRYRYEHEQYRQAERAYRASGDDDLANDARLRADAAYQFILSLQRDEEKLEVRAPAAGVVILPPKEEAIGQTFKPGEVFCQVGNPSKLEAMLVVPYSDTSLIQRDQRVWLKLSGHVGEIIEGKVANISITEIDALPPALSNKSGGEVQSTTNESTKQESPLFRSYAVQVMVPNTEGDLVSGTRGIARLDIGNRSAYWRLKRYFQQTFHFRM